MALLKRMTTMYALVVGAAVRVVEGTEIVGIADQADSWSTCLSGNLKSDRQTVIVLRLSSNMAGMCIRTPMAKR